ncbi:MAG TPA: hypothetical protein VHV49_19240 [Pseudonocardiaceae bacterium]|jgi:hypothetical protein|nr:hypothetical protein [Pseudonocardiaceae bacterium]
MNAEKDGRTFEAHAYSSVPPRGVKHVRSAGGHHWLMDDEGEWHLRDSSGPVLVWAELLDANGPLTEVYVVQEHTQGGA